MALNKATIDLIKTAEGLRLNAYPDPGSGGDPWTIGYGHTSAAGAPPVKKGFKITADEAEDILKRDMVAVERQVDAAVKVPLTDNQRGALVSFTFNLGPANLKKSTLLRKLNEGDYEGAADQFAVWNKAAGKVMKGLVTRRANEARLFRTAGKFDQPDTVVITETTGDPTAHTPETAGPGRFIVMLASLGAAIIAAILSLFGVH